MIAHTESELRQSIVNQCQFLSAQNFNQATTGNISVRVSPVGGLTIEPTTALTNILLDQQILITPSGQDYATLSPDMIVRMDLQGRWEGKWLPSSEWRFHVEILKARPEINAVVHTHSMFATIQSMTRSAIPPCHYLMAKLSSGEIRCAPYARFGSQQLADQAVLALEGRMACLLSNHGAITVGTNLKQAVDNALLLETLAKQFYFAKLAGACLLTECEIAETQAALAELSYFGDP